MKSVQNFLEKLNPKLRIFDNKTIIISEYERFTYKALNEKVNTVSKYLNTFGIIAGDRVGIASDNSINYVISIFALWMMDAVPVPINIKLSASEIKTQLMHLRCKIVLVDYANRKKIPSKGIDRLNINLLDLNLGGASFDYKFNPNKTALILFTSGSSGKPKAVELTFSSLINSAKIGNEFLNQTRDDRWLASLPFYHIGGFSIFFRALMFGTVLIIPPDLKIESLIEEIQSHRPTLTSLVSTQMKQLIDNKIKPNNESRHVLLGGGVISSNLMREALQLGWKVCKVYGSTETSSFVTVLSTDEFTLKPESVGKAIFPNEIFILDEEENELPADTEGEIVVKSPALMKVYLYDDETTKQKLRNGLYFTGDIGYKDEDEYLYVVNRRSDLIVSGGENVNPAEVEEAIMKFPKVKEVCAFGIDDVTWGQKIAAAIVPKQNQQFKIDELKDFMKDKIASFKIPKGIYFVDELPRTELGKVRKEFITKLNS